VGPLHNVDTYYTVSSLACNSLLPIYSLWRAYCCSLKVSSVLFCMFDHNTNGSMHAKHSSTVHPSPAAISNLSAAVWLFH
jgi:hypothetical protein